MGKSRKLTGSDGRQREHSPVASKIPPRMRWISVEIAAGVAAICDEIHQPSPASRILLLGIFPRGEKPDANRATVDAVNQRIARFEARGGVITYLDIGDRFLAADRSISKDLMYDFLHPTAKGYEVWATAMEPTLTRLLSR